jgi:hypothetical protein
MHTYDLLHVALYSLVGTYEHFGAIYCLHPHNHLKFNFQFSVFFLNIYTHLTENTLSQYDNNVTTIHQDENFISKVCMNNAPVFDSYKGGNKL